jgi:phosphopantothenoylcysteine decarboxylase/phosphopantothenate--cysteine ligase
MAAHSPNPSEQTHPVTPQDLTGFEIVVGISGGIAVYKVCSVVSELVQRGAGVTCVMTRSATKFVRPLTFEALSGRQVLTSLWKPQHSYDPQHISLTDAADIFVVAPATANIIAKTAHGVADDLLSTLLTSVNCPVLMAPAMNDRMWANPAVASNVARLREFGYHMIGPAEGWLACRSVGKGRLEEPPSIVHAIVDLLPDRSKASDVDH